MGKPQPSLASLLQIAVLCDTVGAAAGTEVALEEALRAAGRWPARVSRSTTHVRADLILIEVAGPAQQTLSRVARLRAEFPTCPILLFGRGDPDVAMGAVRWNVHDYWVGAPTVDRLRVALQDLVSPRPIGGMARVGQRIRARRQSLGLPLRVAAARCGMSLSMLSQIERGASLVTVLVLHRIALGLRWNLSAMLAGEERVTCQTMRRPPASPTCRDAVVATVRPAGRPRTAARI